jgi:2-isopropylmalate synthase
MQEKLEIARQLENLGVDVIEAGFPISSKGDFEGVRAVARQMPKPVIAALARAVKEGYRQGLGSSAGGSQAQNSYLYSNLGYSYEIQAANGTGSCIKRAVEMVSYAKSSAPRWNFPRKTVPVPGLSFCIRFWRKLSGQERMC